MQAVLVLFGALILFIMIDEWLGGDKREPRDSDHEL